jgi:hypothetical protein
MTESIKKKGSWGGKHQSEKQKRISSETLKRLRREQPEKFVHHKKKTVQPVTPPAEVKPEVKIETPPAPIPVPIPPPPPPAPIEIPPVSQSQPDTVLFGPEQVPPPKIEAGLPPTPPPAPPPNTPGTGLPTVEPTPTPPQEVKKYAVLVWGMIVKTCCAIFGDGFKPILMKSDTGEILYDENAEGVKVWWNWLVSIGVRAFSPVVELWMFMVSYFALRFPLIIARFRKKKPSASPPAPAAAPGTAPEQPPKTAAGTEPAPESKETKQPPPATAGEVAAAVEELN